MRQRALGSKLGAGGEGFATPPRTGQAVGQRGMRTTNLVPAGGPSGPASAAKPGCLPAHASVAAGQLGSAARSSPAGRQLDVSTGRLQGIEGCCNPGDCVAGSGAACRATASSRMRGPKAPIRGSGQHRVGGTDEVLWWGKKLKQTRITQTNNLASCPGPDAAMLRAGLAQSSIIRTVGGRLAMAFKPLMSTGGRTGGTGIRARVADVIRRLNSPQSSRYGLPPTSTKTGVGADGTDRTAQVGEKLERTWVITSSAGRCKDHGKGPGDEGVISAVAAIAWDRPIVRRKLPRTGAIRGPADVLPTAQHFQYGISRLTE